MLFERQRVLTLELIVVQMTALVLSLLLELSVAQSASSDAAAMQELKSCLKLNAKIDWSDSNPCKWAGVICDTNNRVTRIQVKNQGISGTISPFIANLTNLEDLELMNNSLTGPLPSLKGLNSLQTLYLHSNRFTSIPANFFDGMTSLQKVFLDNNPFTPWSIPKGLKDASSLETFSVNSANVGGPIPDLFSPDNFPGLMTLHLSYNNITGGFPSTFSGLGLQSLWVNGQLSNGARCFNGTIEILQNMTQLVEIWLNMNALNGPIPDLSKLNNLESLNLRDNSLSGPVPVSVINLPSLKMVKLTNNLLQGPTPRFPKSVDVDIIPDTNCFCSPDPEVECDSSVNALISVMEPFGYPLRMARAWKGNNPCADWVEIICSNNNITIINLQNKGLVGTLSPKFSVFTSVQTLRLAHNNITGTIPEELTRMPNLKTLDVSFNNLQGKVPSFPNTLVNVEGNPNIDKDPPPSPPSEPVIAPGKPPNPPGEPVSAPGKPPNPPGEPVSPPGEPVNPPDEPPSPPSQPGRPPRGPDSPPGRPPRGPDSPPGKSSDVRVIVGSVIGALFFIFFASMLIYCFLRKNKLRRSLQQSKPMLIHPNHSESDDGNNITLTGPRVKGKAVSDEQSLWSSGPTDVHVIKANNMSISIEILRNVTNDFSNRKILGRGGFGTVYKGKLPDGTEIAVKRMNSGVLGDKGLAEFESEIAVLTKVRHRHLVGLLGFCLDGNEKLLVYEYLPQGTLSRHLFSWKEEGLKPLQWSQRLTIALDVARGVEYLHGLAQQSFIHRDLKPSNILLGDDLRAKVADFGLVRLAPDGGKTSIQTRLAGTFGYLAPEYAGKLDIFVFRYLCEYAMFCMRTCSCAFWNI